MKFTSVEHRLNFFLVPLLVLRRQSYYREGGMASMVRWIQVHTKRFDLKAH